MKLILFSDLHCDREAAERIVESSKQADVLIGAGDFGTKRKGLEITADVLGQAHCPLVAVPGNSESIDELEQAFSSCDHVHVLHGTWVTIAGIVFFGIGGGIPTTPFGPWSWDFSEKQAEDLLEPMPAGSVLVSHSPPWQCVDRDSSGQHRGSTALRSAIKEKSPQLVVCGHVHESWKQRDSIGSTPVINAGPESLVFEL